MDNLDKLYDRYNKLVDAGDKIRDHVDDYNDILAGVKGSPNEKRLASQFIAKFFSKFPELADASLEALVDLCEDEDVNIRKQAIRDLPIICKESPEYVPKITDIMTQLLITDDQNELLMVNASLLTLYKLQPKGFLTGLFSQIENGEEITRERALKFLVAKLRIIPESSWTRELEELLVTLIRKSMVDCTKDEFIAFMTVISGLKISKLVSGQQLIVDIINEQVALETMDVNDAESLDKLLMCVKYASPHFSPFVDANVYIAFFCHQLLPNLDRLNESTPGVGLEVLQLLAELMPNLQPSSLTHPIDIASCQNAIFDRLLKHLPLPPEIPDSSLEESLEFTHIESLLFSFQQITKTAIEFLTNDQERMKDLKIRLQYLARCVQTWQKKLRETPTKGSLSPEVKIMALKTTQNITAMVRDLFHSPPIFKSCTSMNLSWKPAKQAAAAVGVTKNQKSSAITTKSESGNGETQTINKPLSEAASKRKAVTAPEGSNETTTNSSSAIETTNVKQARKQVEWKPYTPPGARFTSRGGRGRATGGHSFSTRGSIRGRGGLYAKRYN